MQKVGTCDAEVRWKTWWCLQDAETVKGVGLRKGGRQLGLHVGCVGDKGLLCVRTLADHLCGLRPFNQHMGWTSFDGPKYTCWLCWNIGGVRRNPSNNSQRMKCYGALLQTLKEVLKELGWKPNTC